MIVDEGIALVNYRAIGIESEQSDCFSMNLLVVQNLIEILFKDSSKMLIIGRNFVMKRRRLHYSLSITE